MSVQIALLICNVVLWAGALVQLRITKRMHVNTMKLWDLARERHDLIDEFWAEVRAVMGDEDPA